jgi:hypothetical protein
MSVLFLDDFARADGSLSGDPHYSNLGDADFDLVSQHIQAVSDSSALYQTSNQGGANVGTYMQVALVSGAATGFLQLMLSLTPDLSGSLYDVVLDILGGVGKFRKNFVQMGSTFSAMPSNGQTVRLALLNGVLALTYDGSLIDSRSDSSLTGPWYNGVNAGAGDGLTPIVLDDFTVGDLLPAIDSVTPASFADGTTGIVIAGQDL